MVFLFASYKLLSIRQPGGDHLSMVLFYLASNIYMMCAVLHLTNGNEIFFSYVVKLHSVTRGEGFRHLPRKKKLCVGQKSIRKEARLHKESFYCLISREGQKK